MKTILVLDAETTGLPDWKKPSGDEQQPHMVQLAATLCDVDTQEVIQSMDVIIRPDGWEIPKEVSEIHGITTKFAFDIGIPEAMALEMLLALWDGCPRVAHNRTFDQRIIRIATKRYSTDEVIEAWSDKDEFYCTMLMAKPIMKMEPKNRFGFKSPKLEEAYKYFTGKVLENAHTAMADTLACKEIYFAIAETAPK